MLSIKSVETTNNCKEKWNKEIHKKLQNEEIEYSLNIHTFNPSKNSPPTSWQIRLKNRLNKFNKIQELTL